MKQFIKRNRKLLVFSTMVVVFLFGIGVIQLVMNQYSSFEDTPVVKVEEKEEETKDDNSASQSEETLKKPVGDDVKIVRKFYDTSLTDEELENALVYFEGVYRPNLGVDFANDDKQFDVLSAISGKVTKKDNDALLGWIVTITNDNGIATTYQSLGEVTVEKDAVIKQGDKIGTSGNNVYEASLKNHLHFVLEKDNKAVNPETFFEQPLSKVSI